MSTSKPRLTGIELRVVFFWWARGFETVGYMLTGTVEHEDFLGHRYLSAFAGWNVSLGCTGGSLREELHEHAGVVTTILMGRGACGAVLSCFCYSGQ